MVYDSFNGDGSMTRDWERVNGTADWIRVAGQARPNSDFDQPIMRRTDGLFPYYQEAEAMLSFTTGGDAAEDGVGVHMGPTSDGWFIKLTPNTITGFRRASGVNNFLDEVTVTAPTASTLYGPVKARYIGSGLEVYFEGALVITMTDATVMPMGAPAIYSNKNTDDPVIDDFRCSDPVQAGHRQGYFLNRIGRLR